MDIANEMRDLANESIVTGPEGRSLLRKGADEIERLGREIGRLEAAIAMWRDHSHKVGLLAPGQ